MMKKQISILTILLLASGLFALFITPRIWDPEPILVFRIGIGAGIALLSVAGAIGYQIFLWGNRFAGKQSTKLLEKAQEDFETDHRLFLQRLNHEIKNPLTGLNADMANILELIDAEEKQRVVKNAFRSLERINQLMDDLRKLSELDISNIEQRPVDVPQLVGEMIAAIESHPKYAGRHINTIYSMVPSPFPVIYGDRDLLGLAIFNILDNALKFTSPEDAIEVRVREDGRAVIIEIADTGGGISINDQEHIFEELYRGSNARGKEGSGLGLPLVKRIIQLHSGGITVRSQQGQTKATVFTIRLSMQPPLIS